MMIRKRWIVLAVMALCLTGCGSKGAFAYQNVEQLFESGKVSNVYYREDYQNDLIKTIDEDYSQFKIENEKDALRSFEQIKLLVGMKDPAKELVFERTMKGPSDGDTIYDFNQYYEGIPVCNGSIRLIVKSDGRPDWFTGNFVPEIELDSVEPAISEQEMVELIEKMENVKKVYDDMSLCIIENEKTDHRPVLAYSVTVDKMTGVWNDPDRKILLDFTYIVNADTGELLFSNPLTIVD